MKVLGIETSCDETAAAVVQDGRIMLSNTVASSMELHKKFGGIVPEIAARSHIEVIIPVIKQALSDAKCDWQEIDAIGVTHGAGLGGSLLIGVMTARTLAIVHQKPLYAVNHVEAHVYANFLTDSALPGYQMPANQPSFPLLAVIISGGHSQLVLFHDHFKYQILGQTQDDAVGEAFDKVAKMLGLPYPGGPAIAEIAKKGNPKAFRLPTAQMDKYDFSFSGLKTAVLRQAQSEIGETYTFPSIRLPERLSDSQKADIAASFQYTAIKTIVEKTRLAYEEFKPKSVLVAGGVASNKELIRQLSAALPLAVHSPDPKLCTDNAAMVAALAYFEASHHQDPADPYKLTIHPSLSM
ncbi:MAG TPA: tRNA (adenosine(37)-N6)-threonylcarbamoyltransferase complex transferase subunit TsaD [Candidatus Saccharimonadales bacterium]|nr:tRNA (adenosine(37)-N6)-threonylcarbamoyltransferase complex transferase subunit TsaD [Candidatus Saccharimonadales bacterium]